MAVVCEIGQFVLLDCKTYFDEVYKICLDRNSSSGVVRLTCPSEVFAILTPLRMDSENPEAEKRKKRKRKFVIEDAFADFDELRPYFTDCLQTLVPLAKEKGLLRNSLTQEEIRSNNKEARGMVQKFMQFTFNLDEEVDDEKTLKCYQYDGGVYDINAARNAITDYRGDTPTVLEIAKTRYVIPPWCSFLNCDIKRFPKVLTLGKKFDSVVLDPPWVNKSVKRKKNYDMLTLENIRDLPIKELVKHGGLVATWVTNNKTQLKYVKEVLYPTWGISLAATWHWLKLTVTGEPICGIDSRHKRPYEHVILGFASGSSQEPAKVIDDHKIFCSVPSSIHSHKPPLTELLKPYVEQNAQCLELFARSLLPGWTSWGNQVLQFQQLHCFEVH